jgi:hypothetical protein
MITDFTVKLLLIIAHGVRVNQADFVAGMQIYAPE